MYDTCDVLHASYCSADVATHVLREYGEGSMGKGIRKLAGEMLTIGGYQSYGAGLKKGLLKGTIIGVCLSSAVLIGGWCTKKIVDYHNIKKAKRTLTETSEEELHNVKE